MNLLEWIIDNLYWLIYKWNKQCLWLLMGILNIGLTFSVFVWYILPKEERPLLSLWIKARMVATILPEKEINLSFKDKVYRLPAKTTLRLSWSKRVTQYLKECLVFTEWLLFCELLLIITWITTPYLQSKMMQYQQKRKHAKQTTIVAVSSQPSNHDSDKTQQMTTEQTVAKTQPYQKMPVGDPPTQQKKKQSSKNKSIVKSNKLNLIRHTKAMNKRTLDDVEVVL